MLSVTTTQRLRKRRVGSPAQLGLQSLLVASPLSAAVSLAVPFLFRHASTNHHGRIWPCVIRRPTRAGGHAIGDVFVTSEFIAHGEDADGIGQRDKDQCNVRELPYVNSLLDRAP